MPPELDAELRAIRARALAPTGTWVQDRADRDALLAHITAFEIMRTELAEVLRQQALDARTIEHLGQQATHAQSRYDALDADFKALEQGAHRLATELDEARTLLATATTAAFSHVTKLMEVERERDDARRLAAEADARARDAYNRAIGTKQNSDVWIDQRNKAEAERDTLAVKLAEVERERNEQRRLLIEFGPFKMRTAEALADEVAAMVRRREIDARCPAADALLDFRNPPERFAPNVQEQLDTALAEQQRLAAEVEEIDVQLQDTQADYGKLEVEVERMRPIVTAVGTWRAFNALPGTHEDRSRAAGQIGSDLVVARYLDAIAAAHATYLATTQRAETPEPLKSNDAEVM